MEQKGAFTVAMVTSVVLLSCLACTVSCRPNEENSSSTYISSNNNSYLKGQHYQHQVQRYATHHHQHRGTDLEKNHHHHPNNDNNHPHHHSNKQGHHHHNQNAHYRELKDAFERDTDINESLRMSSLHDTSGSGSNGPHSGKRLKQRPPLTLPMMEAPSSTKSAMATTTASSSSSSSENFPVPRRLHSKPVEDDYEEEYEEEEDDDVSSGGGRHAYLMTKDKKKSSKEKLTEDQALTQAFEKHMRPSSLKANPKEEFHDVYAYQLPSDLWFVVRYNRNSNGQVEKYMNILDSFTNYLDKLDQDVKTVSVNVKGVETVFRLTTKQNSRSSS